MHLAVNAFFWDQPHTGSGQYTRQLVTYLNQLVSDLEITLIVPRGPGAPQPEGVPTGVHVLPVPLRPGQLGKVRFEQVDFPRACGAAGVDLAHVPYWAAPLRSPVPVIVTIHDIITLLTPEYRRGVKAKLYHALVSASARGAAGVITDSQASRADIIRHLGLDPARVTPVYLGIGPEYTAQPSLLLDMAAQRRYGLPDAYVLYLGGYNLHKNVTTLLLAYAFVARALGDEYPLLLAGRPPDGAGRHVPNYDRLIADLDLSDSVRWLGFVAEGDKPALYRHASVFVFPSRYEGFGLPPLEAMACGTPVVATTGGSLDEVLGDAALAVDPDDERGMGGAIIAALVQDELAADLKERGQRRAGAFTWERTIRETLQVYTKALSG